MVDLGRLRDFVVLFEKETEGGFPVRVVDSPAGDGEAVFHLPEEPEIWSGAPSSSSFPTRIVTLAPSPSRSGSPKRIGRALFRALFSGKVGECLAASRLVTAQPGEGLRIQLRFRPGEAERRLRYLPWELLNDENGRFLALDGRVSVVRSLDAGEPIFSTQPPESPRIVVIVPRPAGMRDLCADEEVQAIHDAWSDGAGRVEVLARASLEALLTLGPPVDGLHFIGHGGLDPATGKPCLFFESRDGSPDPVSAETLATLLQNVPGLRLVVLNACETANSSAASLPGGDLPLAAAESLLIVGGLPAVVAMQRPVSDLAAVFFGGALHRRLAAGDLIERAVTAARLAVYARDRTRLEWAVPVLHSRGPAAAITRPASAAATAGQPGSEVRIGGDWRSETTFPTGNKDWHQITIVQTGTDVSARAVCTDGYSKGKSYEIRGTFGDRVLTGTYTLVDDQQRQVERGALALQLRRDGQVLTGYMVYSDDREEGLFSVPLQMERLPDASSTP